ncbi:MAG: hypothetical protein NVSMB47_03810 [Polyangiales bacterium]
MPRWFALSLVAIPIGCASAPMPPPDQVRVRIVSRGDPLEVRLTPDSASALASHIRHCTTPCDRPLWTGAYKLHVDGPNVTALDARLRIRDPSWVVVRPGSEALHYSGLFVATLSMIVAPASAFLGVLCTNSTRNDCRSYLYTFLGAALGIPAGWIMYSAGRTTFEVMPAWAPAPPAPLHTVRERAGSVAMDRGGLGWTWQF